MTKRICTLLLAAVLLIGLVLPGISADAAAASLVKKNGIWYYMQNGKVCNITTLVKYNGGWWYVVNGKVASNTTSLVKYNNAWWYVVNGKVASNTTSLVKYGGEWWYVVKGKVASNTTSLVKYNNEWWYVVKGKIAANTTSLVKFNGGWYYIYKGKVASNTTTLVEYKGTWYYVNKGKVDFSADTLVNYKGKLYYVNCGKVDNQSTTIVQYGLAWYNVNAGKVTPSSTQSNGSGYTYYVYRSNGKLARTYNDTERVYYSYNSKGQLSSVDGYWLSYGASDIKDKAYLLWDEKYSYHSDGRYTITYSDEGSTEVRHYTKNGRLTNSTYYDDQSDGDYSVKTYHYNNYGDVDYILIERHVEGKVSHHRTEYRYKYNAQKKAISRFEYWDGKYQGAEYYVYDTQGRLARKLEYDSFLTVYTYNSRGDIDYTFWWHS